MPEPDAVPDGPPKRTARNSVGTTYWSGAVLGVVLGAVPEDPLEPLEPPMFGQLALDPVWVLGIVEVPPDGAVVPGDVDGAGLAAETAATPPPTRSRPEITAVMTARRMPPVVATGPASTGGVWIGWGCRGWNVDSIETPWFG